MKSERRAHLNVATPLDTVVNDENETKGDVEDVEAVACRSTRTDSAKRPDGPPGVVVQLVMGVL